MQKIIKHKIISSAFLVSFLLVTIGFVRAYFTLRSVSQPLIIHFNNALGINQIGGLWDLAAVAVFGLVSLGFDFLLSIELDERDPFLGKITAAAGLFLSILIFIGFSAIISVN